MRAAPNITTGPREKTEETMSIVDPAGSVIPSRQAWWNDRSARHVPMDIARMHNDESVDETSLSRISGFIFAWRRHLSSNRM
jgi:hypothetical protein